MVLMGPNVPRQRSHSITAPPLVKTFDTRQTGFIVGVGVAVGAEK